MTGRRFAVVLLPLLVVLGGVLYLGLGRDPKEIPSPLIGKPLPTVSGVDLQGNPRQLPLVGRPMLINVWASWCSACAVEHPAINQAARKYSAQVDFVGINYRDNKPDSLRWLTRLGNPYQWSLEDSDGRAGIELGVYGAPESYFVDARGIIVDKKIGPFGGDELDAKLHELFGITN